MKGKLIAAAVVSALPIVAVAAEWHMVPDDVNAGVPVKTGNVIGAVSVGSIKKNGDYAEAQVAIFYTYDLLEAAVAKASAKHSDLKPKLQAAIAGGHPSVYAGMERLFMYRGSGPGFDSGEDAQIRTVLVASELLIDEGYAPISTRTIQVQCKSRLDFEYRYDGSGGWTLTGLPRDGSGQRGELLPFICDKVGMGQNEPTSPPPPSPEMVLLRQIFDMRVVPRWNFLGVRTDGDGRSYFVFFGADTIQRKRTYTDVVTGSVKYHHGPNEPPNYPDEMMPPDALISNVLEGKHRPESLSITHVDCAAETVLDYSEAKTFEAQLVSYVCSHEVSQPIRGSKRP